MAGNEQHFNCYGMDQNNLNPPPPGTESDSEGKQYDYDNDDYRQNQDRYQRRRRSRSRSRERCGSDRSRSRRYESHYDDRDRDRRRRRSRSRSRSRDRDRGRSDRDRRRGSDYDRFREGDFQRRDRLAQQRDDHDSSHGSDLGLNQDDSYPSTYQGQGDNSSSYDYGGYGVDFQQYHEYESGESHRHGKREEGESSGSGGGSYSRKGSRRPENDWRLRLTSIRDAHFNRSKHPPTLAQNQFQNDGSFLEMFKKKMAAGNADETPNSLVLASSSIKYSDISLPPLTLTPQLLDQSKAATPSASSKADQDLDGEPIKKSTLPVPVSVRFYFVRLFLQDQSMLEFRLNTNNLNKVYINFFV